MSTNPSPKTPLGVFVKENERAGSADEPSPVTKTATLGFVSSISKDEPVVTRRELWSYYLYYNGDNGVGPNGYAMTLFQSLAFAAGFDPVKGPGSSCSAEDASGQCVLPWGGGTKSVSSVVLVANGVSFAVMTMIFTTIGSAADYGTFGRWLLLVITIICWGAQFATMSLTVPSRWGVGMALYMIGFISYGATLVFYAAAFPRLARNTAHARAIREKFEAGELSKEEHDIEESMEKNRISNISTNDKFSFSFLQNTYLGLAQAITSTMATLGFWYIQRYWKFSTKTMFVVTNVVTVLIPLWGMIGIWTTRFGFHNVWEFWAYNVVFGLFQAPYYAFSQTMMAELSPPGFDNMVTPILLSTAQHMLSLLAQFFGLFGLSNRASSMIGPNVIQAIIDKSGNNWMGFPFLFTLCACASLVIWFGVNVTKGRNDAVTWAEGVRMSGDHSQWADEAIVESEKQA
ncbi:hypothetical protein H0H87_010731 [Tephrocybe sp. NHM501043]|nr:hypothetical protein H0H87_010731 [Tephrocybe sp. NHM501043]